MKKDSYIKLQAQRLTTGQINRRRFIMSALATGVTLPTAMSLAGRAEAMTPKAGGFLRIAVGYGSTTDVLDPSTSENGFSQNVIYARGNHLTEVSNTGELIGELAESFEPSNGAKTWAFNLRQGVEFHNGKTLTAEDVVATFNYHRGEDSKSAAKGLLSAVTDIRADGANRVIFDLETGNADFPFIVSDYHFLIMPSEGGSVMDANSPVGTGGYMVDAYEPGVRAKFSRNPNYWKEGRAHFDEYEVLSILDVTARQNAVMNGDVHYADSV
ncbi:MAG: peptide ABC transporter substrate-binding protein, partial [Boseongicola sp.]|nr:peptide ABC transporter substrate-binding protein [Boseongicola sp.]